MHIFIGVLHVYCYIFRIVQTKFISFAYASGTNLIQDKQIEDNKGVFRFKDERVIQLPQEKGQAVKQ